MYDEFERAVTGRSGSGGVGWFGWVAAGFGFFFLVGVAAIGFAINYGMHHGEGFVREFEVGTGFADLATLADLQAQKDLISMDPDRGLEFLRALPPGDPTEAFVGRVAQGMFDRVGHNAHVRHAPRAPAPPDVPAVPEIPDIPELPAAPAQPDAPADASVAVSSPDGNVHIAVDRSGGRKSIVIDAGDEHSSFSLTRGDDGAQLVIETGDETVRIGTGGEAQAMPGWVPRFGGMPERPRPIYSLESDEGTLGAVSWSGAAGSADVLAYYRAELERQGYDVRDEVRASQDGAEDGAFWARSQADGRVVFVVTHAEADGTKVLLGFGEER